VIQLNLIAMTIQTSFNGVSIENGSFVGTFSKCAFAAALYNKKRIDRKTFETIRKYAITVEYATRLVNDNIDIFKD
jgi:hypothetical protein